MRNDVPLEVIDPFPFVDRDGQALVLTSALEQARIAEVRPDADVALFDDFGLYDLVGHGVGLEVHEPPRLGLGSGETLVAGDVLAIEPGLEGLEGLGGVRFEDLLLITDDGCETLTSYPYHL